MEAQGFELRNEAYLHPDPGRGGREIKRDRGGTTRALAGQILDCTAAG